MLNGRTAPPSGELTLDARLCAELGTELTRSREAMGLTRAQVGERLLLSTRQVQALETVEFPAFHNATFHLGALRKYVAFAGLDERLLNQIAAGLVKPDPQAILLVPSASSDDARESLSTRVLAIVGTLAVAAVLGAGGFYLAHSRTEAKRTAAEPTSPSPAVQAPTPVRSTPPTSPAPEPAAVTATDVPAAPSEPLVPSSSLAADAQAFGSVRVLHPAWIFVRDVESVVTERSLTAGETFALDSQPSYLAIGTADAELMVGSTRVDVSRFVTNGQIRLRAGDFDAIVQGVSPIPAPTPVARP